MVGGRGVCVCIFIFGLVRPSQYSAHRCSLPSLPSLEKHQHRPGETTDCSCHHTGPSPPGYKEQGDGVFRGKNVIQNWAGQPQVRPFATNGHRPTTGTSGATATPHECSWLTSQSNQVKAILQVVTALGLRQRRPVISKQKGITSASLPPS